MPHFITLLSFAVVSHGEDNAPAPPQAVGVPREGQRLTGAQPNPTANSEPPPTPSPAVRPAPEHFFKLVVLAQGPRIWLLERQFYLEGNEPPGNAKKQASKQTKSLRHLVWLTLKMNRRHGSWKVEVRPWAVLSHQVPSLFLAFDF